MRPDSSGNFYLPIRVLITKSRLTARTIRDCEFSSVCIVRALPLFLKATSLLRYDDGVVSLVAIFLKSLSYKRDWFFGGWYLTVLHAKCYFETYDIPLPPIILISRFHHFQYEVTNKDCVRITFGKTM